jgi:nucleoside-diphosphate-sugar epimerase
MKVLVTGASGFLGRNLLRRFPEEWQVLALYRSDRHFPAFVDSLERSGVVPAQCDLTNAAQVAELMREHGGEWDACLYLAARVDIPWSVRDPRADLTMNTTSLLNVLEAVYVDRFVYLSSGAVYDGLRGEVPPSAAVAPTLPYAISKLACEQYVRYFQARRKSIEHYLNVRFFGAFGPFEAPHKIYTRLIRALAFDRADSYQIYGDGKNLIDAMYVDDAVEAIHRIVVGEHWNTTVNLAGGSPTTIETLVRRVAIALNRDSVRIEKSGLANEKNDFWGSTAEMRQLFGFSPMVSLEDGVGRLSRFLQQHDHAR